MPRFANLKGSMNPFDNNKPVLSSSERLKNKRDKTIYQSQKQHFQSKRKCGNKNVKYYDNGTIRSTKSYKIQNSLAKGNVLCEDCNGKGTLCDDSSQHTKLNKIEMGNNSLAEFWGGGGLGWDFADGTPVQQQGYTVIQSDISGVWGGSTTDISKADLSGAILPSIPPNPMPYGYINNLINIPRNLDGSGIVIDPSNILFPANICNKLNNLSRKELFPYMKLSNLKTYLVIRGGIAIHPYNPSLPIADGSLASLCNDPSYNNLIGALVIGSPEVGGLINADQTYFTGVIKHVCCIREQVLVYNNGTSNTAPSTGWTVTPVPKIGIFDLFIELLYTPTATPLFNPNNTLSQLIKESPAPYTNIKVAESGVGQIPFTFGWSSFFAEAGLIIEKTVNGTVTTPVITYFRALTESIRIFQGSCHRNQTIGNITKQSYMSCLEDGTKKINFTT
jgi:hypothetical protein